MKKKGLKTATAVLAAAMMLQGVAFADGGDHHGGGSFWSDGGGWAVFGALVVFGGILLYRSGSSDGGGSCRNAELSPEKLKPVKEDSKVSVALFSAEVLDVTSQAGKSSVSKDKPDESLGLALAFKF